MTNAVASIARKRGRPPGAKSRARDGKNQSLTRALTLLERLSESDSGMHLTDLSYQLGMPAATVHRLLSTFEELRDFVASARPYMHALVEECGETVNLGVIDDGQVVFISQVESREVMRMIVRLGSRSPIHASGVGKAMLAAGDAHTAATRAGQVHRSHHR
jgi:IclR family acetate operon transcriptional repressor